MKTLTGLAAAAVLLTGAWGAAAQPDAEIAASPFMLTGERAHSSIVAAQSAPIVRLLADAHMAQSRDDRPERVSPPARRAEGEEERGSRRGPAEAREAMRRVRIDRLKETLGLDDQETEKVVERLEAHEEKHRELERELGRARRALRQALREDEDEETISEKLEGTLDLEVEKIRHRGSGYREMTEDFDVEQQARFYLFIHEFEDDMRHLVERARAMRRMAPDFHERFREMGPQERREFFREHGLFPGLRDEAESGRRDERRSERPDARREDNGERPRARREAIGEEEREAVRRRLERMAEDMGEEEAERWRERLERMFDFVSEEVPELWRERVEELREQWLERRRGNSNDAEVRPRPRRPGAPEERIRVRERDDEALRELRALRDGWTDMSRAERREAFRDAMGGLERWTEEAMRRFLREGPQADSLQVDVDVRVYGAPVWADPNLAALDELRENWADLSPSERRAAFRDAMGGLDRLTEREMRRFMREGPEPESPRVGTLRSWADPNLEALEQLRENWADLSPSERRAALRDAMGGLDRLTEREMRRFLREGPEAESPRVRVERERVRDEGRRGDRREEGRRMDDRREDRREEGRRVDDRREDRRE